MTAIEKLALAMGRPGIPKEAVIGSLLGGLVRGGGKMLAAPVVGAGRMAASAGRGLMSAGRQVRGFGAEFMTRFRGGTPQQAMLAGQAAALPRATTVLPSKASVSPLSRIRETASRVSGAPVTSPPPPIVAAPATRTAPAPAAPQAGKKGRRGAKANSQATQNKTWGGASHAAFAGASMVMTPSQSQQQPQGGIAMNAETVEALFSKVAQDMPGASEEERAQVVASFIIRQGFDAAIAEAAGVSVEKTASVKETDPAAEKKAGEIRFNKLTTKDVISHLAAQWGRPEELEKGAAHRPGLAKLAKLVEVELARPS